MNLLEDLINYLNSLLEIDRDAITELCNARVKVTNNGLLEHPTVQCGIYNGEYKVGLLGILNGFLGAREDQKGYLCAYYDEHSKIVKFGVTP